MSDPSIIEYNRSESRKTKTKESEFRSSCSSRSPIPRPQKASPSHYSCAKSPVMCSSFFSQCIVSPHGQRIASSDLPSAAVSLLNPRISFFFQGHELTPPQYWGSRKLASSPPPDSDLPPWAPLGVKVECSRLDGRSITMPLSRVGWLGEREACF